MDFTTRQFKNFVDECVEIVGDNYEYDTNPHEYHHVVRRDNGDSLVFLYINPKNNPAFVEVDYHTDNGESLLGSETFNSKDEVKTFLKENVGEIKEQF